MKHLLIGIAGRANAGKDTAAKLLAHFILNNFLDIPTQNVILLSASDIVRKDVAEMTGGNMETIDNNKRIYPALRWILEKYGTDYLGEEKITKRLSEHISSIMNLRINKPCVIIIPSVRSINQVELIRNYKGIIICIRRELEDTAREAYPSEVQVEKLKPDFVVNNDWSLLRFESMIKDLFKAEIQPRVKLLLKDN